MLSWRRLLWLPRKRDFYIRMGNQPFSTNPTMKNLFVFPSVPRALCVAVFFCLSAAPHARAELTITGQERFGDVVFTFSGTMDTTGAVGAGPFFVETKFEPSEGDIEAWQTDSDTARLALDAAVPFGTGPALTDVGVGSGDNIALLGDDLYLEDTYVSGSPLNATLTLAGTDFATLGVDAAGGPYMWTVTGNGDTVVMSFLPTLDNSAARAALLKKIKKLQKKSKKFKKKGKKAKAKKLGKKVKKLKAQLAALV